MRPEEFLEFVWEGQEGWFELARTPQARGKKHGTFLERAEAIAQPSSFNYFAPLARKRHGSCQVDVVDVGNVVWVDVDRRDAPMLVEKHPEPLGLAPSVIVDSGNKGFWPFYKLNSLVPTDKIAVVNKALEQYLKSVAPESWTGTAWSKEKIARMPGSFREETQRHAQVSEATLRVLPLAAFEVLPSTSVTPGQGAALALPEMPQEYRSVVVPCVTLSQPLEEYMRARPSEGQGWDRSVMEQKIFTALIAKGLRSEQIIAFAFDRGLPKHREEWNRQQGNWTMRSIEHARNYLDAKPHKPFTHAYSHFELGEWLQLLREPMSTKEFVEGVGGEKKQRSAERFLTRCREEGYVKTIDDDSDRRKKINHLTDKGKATLEPSTWGYRRASLPNLRPGGATQHYAIRTPRSGKGVRTL